MYKMIASGTILKWVPAILVSVLIAVVAVAAGIIPVRFTIVLIGGISVAVSSLFFKDKKLFYLVLLALVLPVNITKRVIIINANYPPLMDSLAVSITDTVLAILYGIWFFRIISLQDRNKTVFFNFISIPLLVMMIFALVSLMNAGDMWRGSFEIIRMLKGLLLYFYIINNVRTEKEVSSVIGALGIGVLFLCAIACLQFYFKKSLGLVYMGEVKQGIESFMGAEKIFRAGATMGNPNVFAYYLEFLIPLMLFFSFLKKNASLRSLAALGFVGGSIALILSFSRGGWIACGIATVLALFTVVRKNFHRREFIGRSLMIILIMLVLTGIFAGKIQKRLLSSDAGAANIRLLQMDVAKKIILAHPFIGVGINNYGTVMEKYDDTSSRVARYFPFPIHNVYVLYCAEMGMFGVIAFLCLVTAILLRGVRNFARSDGVMYALNAGLLFGFIGYFIHISVDMNAVSSFPQFYFMAGIFAVADSVINAVPRTEKYGDVV